ncbi:MAG: hypothetical protein JKY12_06180 [Sneathiella sp.]|nr:hypothetical protein [Sneathiella sp.]
MASKYLGINRRTIITGSSAALFVSAVQPVAALENSTKEALRLLAGKVFYSSDRPGRWKGKENGHVPLIKIDKDKNSILIRAATNHPMQPNHNVIKHVLMDENLNFIQEQIFDQQFDMPRSRFELNGYKGRLYIGSLCNLHDNWINWADV